MLGAKVISAVPLYREIALYTKIRVAKKERYSDHFRSAPAVVQKTL